ncbi:CRISPR-associated family protein [Acinetobacter sp. 983759]|uniref:type I-F CRISPR-associated protein Csy3 n=1 Tax=Acinetobacter TaxID=469 RepID=UPI00044F0782|nr:MULTISPECIES: type I-F CRISPR-associated protein Csy3 [Acinetobacter]EXE13012.1 CRISPR-associated family protein [Acinetobacter sp. 983759]MCU4501119.1 type I-F CRISPR-associated protein Csy3 [Acinetobacter radioresistens]
MTIFKKLPGSLSLQRGTVVSDGAFFNLFEDGKQEPLHVMYHGIRGTQNVAGNKEKGAATGNSLAREVTNIQVTESVKLKLNSKLLVKWNFRFIDLSCVLFATASAKGTDKNEEYNFRQAFLNFVNHTKESDGLKEVVRRYVRNIVNGRWLWRNRIVAESITIQVTAQDYPETFSFDALSYNLKSFDRPSEQEQKLADILLKGITGESTNAALHIEAIVDFGMGGVEVFPSQNYLGKDKPEGFSRSLYQLTPKKPDHKANDNQYLGQAALRDQKIGNALRTIDTWYPQFKENDEKPIAVEPNGANLEGQIFYRVGKDKVSAFDILKEIDELDPNSEKGMFLIACLIRGGVYSEGK